MQALEEGVQLPLGVEVPSEQVSFVFAVVTHVLAVEHVVVGVVVLQPGAVSGEG